MLHSRSFSLSQLRRVKSADEFRIPGEPPLGVGDCVMLNSGGPLGLIVDILGGDHVVVAWHIRSSIIERTLPAVCVHRSKLNCSF